MKNKFVLNRCVTCGNLMEVLKSRNQINKFVCCGKDMEEVKVNFEANENHKPIYEKLGSYIVAKVNHKMQKEHHIEYLALDGNKINAKKYFDIFEEPKAIFPYIKGSKIYAYCSKDGMWETIVE